MISSTSHSFNLTVSNSSSATYALTVMTIVAVIFLPLVLLYQGWSYHVFRDRVGGAQSGDERPQAPPGASATTVADR